MSTTETPFERKMREKLARQATAAPAVGAVSQPMAGTPTASINHEDNAPTEEQLGQARDPQQQALDDAIEQIGIVEAYVRWCRKMVPKVGTGQTESIKVSCPNPQHPDRNPSAWLNSDKGTWYCAACDQGGDKWDLAAWHFSFPVPGYKDDKGTFRDLRQQIGEQLGFKVFTSITGSTVVVTPQQAEEEEQEEKKENSSKVGKLPAAVTVENDEEEYALSASAPTIDWRSIVQEDSFLRAYLEATTRDTCPEEYHFWNGMIALGLAAGRDVLLTDIKPVVPNLFVCLTGPSGAGKSISTGHLENLLRAAIPYDDNNTASRGAKHLRAPGSAEYLIANFQAIEEDPTNPKAKYYFPVRSLVEFSELSSLMNTANRVGNNLKPQLMDIFDAKPVIESGSLTGGKRRAEHAFGSVISTTQNRSLRKLLSNNDDDSGFINRWLFAQGKLKKRMSIGGADIELTEAQHKLTQIHQWCFGGKKVNLTPDAFTRWDEFFHSTVDPTQIMADKKETAVLGRVDLMMKKLMLLFSINRMEDAISLASVEQAIQLWPYLISTYGVVGKEMQRTESNDLQDQVLASIKRFTDANGEPPGTKMIYDSVKRKLKNAKELADILATMVRLNLIVEDEIRGKVGRPKKIYKVAK